MASHDGQVEGGSDVRDRNRPAQAVAHGCGARRQRRTRRPAPREADRWQRDRLLRFAAPFEPRTWAVEASGGLGALLAQQLVAADECVVDAPPTRAARAAAAGSNVAAASIALATSSTVIDSHGRAGRLGQLRERGDVGGDPSPPHGLRQCHAQQHVPVADPARPDARLPQPEVPTVDIHHGQPGDGPRGLTVSSAATRCTSVLRAPDGPALLGRAPELVATSERRTSHTPGRLGRIVAIRAL